MWGHVRQYLHDGTLPPNGTVCRPDCEMYGEGCEPASGVLGLLIFEQALAEREEAQADQ